MQFLRSYLAHALHRHDVSELKRVRKLIEEHTPSNTETLLRDLLQHCSTQIPFYQKFTQASPSDIQTFPILTKSDIREHFSDLSPADLSSRGAYLAYTSGSTGKPLTVLHDSSYKIWARSAEDHFYRSFLRLAPGSIRKVVMWASLQHMRGEEFALRRRIRLWITQTTFMNTLLIHDYRVFVDAINARKPDVLQGYAYALYFLAKYIQKNNLPVHSPKFIYSSAEAMLPHMRAVVEEVFQCPVRNFYGSREVGPIAGECEKGRYHVFDYYNYVEILNAKGERCAPGEEGRIAVTTLRNYSMPLVRYEIGDRGVASSGCDCGNPLAVFEKLAGRITDYFPRRDGGLVDGGYFMAVMHGNEWADEFQILHTDYDRIEIQYTPRRHPTEEEKKKITHDVRRAMGDSCEVIFRELSEIPRNSFGKFLHTRTLVDQQYSNVNINS